MSRENDTIFAPATATGRAGVSVLRVSGPEARRAIERMARKFPKPRQATLCLLNNPDTGEPIDRALLLWFPGPHSFTGEDIVEIHAHGSRAVVASLLEVLSNFSDYRLAEPGEFARRAFENGKLDLTAVEGLADLINAETDAQRKQALRQSEGELGKLYEQWRNQMIRAAALMEALLDFSDEEDVSGNLYDDARAIVEQLHRSISDHLTDGHRGERLRDGFQIVIAGAPNVGKSTLLNSLAKRDAAIISSEPGTTRDIIEVQLDIGGYPVLIMDTAGIRETDGLVEKEGIRRTIARLEDADLVLWLWDLQQSGEDTSVLPLKAPASNQDKVWRIVSKADLSPVSRETSKLAADLMISAHTGLGISDLIDRIEAHISQQVQVSSAPAITRARHREEVSRAQSALELFLAGHGDDPELRAEDLRQASIALGRLTGRIDVEDLLGHIFGEFCIGK